MCVSVCACVRVSVCVRVRVRTCRWWGRAFLERCSTRSQSVQRWPHSEQVMMAVVSPSSWLSQVGCNGRRALRSELPTAPATPLCHGPDQGGPNTNGPTNGSE